MIFDIHELDDKKSNLIQTLAIEFVIIRGFKNGRFDKNEKKEYEYDVILTENGNTFIFWKNHFILRNSYTCEMIASKQDDKIILYDNYAYNQIIKSA